MTQDDPLDHSGLLMFEGAPVLLDTWVARAFEEDVRVINQAVSRNPEKFDDRHVFRLSKQQRDFLRSQGVIPKPKGRGGSQMPPMVYTQKGVARLATVLKSPKALEATDLIIDLFTEVYVQIAQGRQEVQVANPGRLLPKADIAARIAQIKTRLLDQIDTLMQTEIDPGGRTVRDEISSVGATLYDDLKARLRRKGLENEKLEAEILKLLEEVQSLRQDRAVKARKSELEHEAMALENLRSRIALVRDTLQLMDEMEPNALVTLNQKFLTGTQDVLRLPGTKETEQ